MVLYGPNEDLFKATLNISSYVDGIIRMYENLEAHAEGCQWM